MPKISKLTWTGQGGRCLDLCRFTCGVPAGRRPVGGSGWFGVLRAGCRRAVGRLPSVRLARSRALAAFARSGMGMGMGSGVKEDASTSKSIQHVYLLYNLCILRVSSRIQNTNKRIRLAGYIYIQTDRQPRPASRSRPVRPKRSIDRRRRCDTSHGVDGTVR